MKIEFLRLANFRGFKELQIEFPKSNVAVFIGINGSGKSSILDSIGTLLSGITNRFTSERRNKLFVTDDDVHVEASDLEIGMRTSHSNETGTHLIGWSLERSQFKNTRLVSGVSEYLDNIEDQLRENPKESLPVLVYYTATRLVHDPDAKTRSKPKNYKYTTSK